MPSILVLVQIFLPSFTSMAQGSCVEKNLPTCTAPCCRSPRPLIKPQCRHLQSPTSCPFFRSHLLSFYLQLKLCFCLFSCRVSNAKLQGFANAVFSRKNTGFGVRQPWALIPLLPLSNYVQVPHHLHLGFHGWE